MRQQRQNDPQMTQAQRSEEARRLRDRFNWLEQFTDEELQQISFCETGAEMASGETYFDISNPENGAFVGQPGHLVPKGGCLVSKQSVPASIWAKLVSYPSRR
ncbi:MAG TPA: hypothetical protein VNL16_15880 [Chloroflexota bacterium]|nr:hypothetical protein [Chloroflexota bacterium]